MPGAAATELPGIPEIVPEALAMVIRQDNRGRSSFTLTRGVRTRQIGSACATVVNLPLESLGADRERDKGSGEAGVARGREAATCSPALTSARIADVSHHCMPYWHYETGIRDTETYHGWYI